MKAILSLLGAPHAEAPAPPQTIMTQAALPNDCLIHHPQPPAAREADAAPVEVIAEFKGSRVVHSLAQGNWVRKQRLITYRVPSTTPGLPLLEFSFICWDSYPAPGAGLRVCLLPWPFRRGRMKFTLRRDSHVAFKPFFEILRYEPVAG